MTAYADSFTRANETPFSAPQWVKAPGSSASNFNLSSGAVSKTASGDCAYYLMGAATTAGQWAQATRASKPVENDWGPAVHIGEVGHTLNLNLYFAQCYEPTAGGVDRNINKIVNGSYTRIQGTTIGTVGADGDVMYLEAFGTTLNFKINGSLSVTTSDTSLSSGQPGLFIYNTGGAIDDFSGGDIGGVIGFPQNYVLDDFNRSTLGSNWSAAYLDSLPLPNPTSTDYLVATNNYLGSLWVPAFTLGDLEAFCWLKQDGGSLLAEQCMLMFVNSSTNNGYALEFRIDDVFVFYPINGGVEGSSITTFIPPRPLTAGDHLGVRMFKNAKVEVYLNSDLVASYTHSTPVTGWAGVGGDKIGLELGNTSGMQFDYFGGGAYTAPAIPSGIFPPDYNQFPKYKLRRPRLADPY